MEPLPTVFDIFVVYRTDFTFEILNKIRNILQVMVLLEACDVNKHCRYAGHHLGFYQELEIW